jgi:hypothetical protein
LVGYRVPTVKGIGFGALAIERNSPPTIAEKMIGLGLSLFSHMDAISHEGRLDTKGIQSDTA